VALGLNATVVALHSVERQRVQVLKESKSARIAADVAAAKKTEK